MINKNYTCINTSTFEITNMGNNFIVDYMLGKTISILNKKGYYTEICNRAKISKPFMISDLIHNLVEERLLEINDKTIEKLKKIIDYNDSESTIIIFKDKYLFDQLPKGFKLIENKLLYNLKVLKDELNIEFKSLLELDKENNKSLKALEEWAEKLPINK